MNSLSEFLSSPLLDFIPSNSTSNNTEQPDELDMLLETLSESDIQLLDSRVTDDFGNDKYQQDQDITVASASDISCYSTCSGNTTNHTSLTSAFAAATETDSKRLKDQNKNKNTMKSTVTWIKWFETWQKVREIANELENMI